MPVILAISLILSPLILAIFAGLVWSKYFSHRIGVTPVEESILRAPGETQRERIEEIHEKVVPWILAMVGLPILFAQTYFQLSQVAPQSNFRVIVMTLLGSILVVIFAVQIFKLMKELRNRRLGYAGECLVAERLQGAAGLGFHIFHDCPADQHGNIDHIVVTPTRIYAIETKTRRKRLSVETHRYDAQVIYDGKSLTYPFGVETFGLDQARRQARWLSKMLSEFVCENIAVSPVLALPGWCVERTGRGDVYVLNPKQFPALFREAPRPVSAEAARRTAQIVKLLEKRCRDVPFPGVISAKEARKAAWRALTKERARAAKNRPSGAPPTRTAAVCVS